MLLTSAAFAGSDGNYTYLALGDSVSYGLDVTLLPTAPGQPLPSPGQFVGYPEYTAQFESLFKATTDSNTSCPGETSGSFIDVNAPDNGCHGLGPQKQPPFKPTIGLHTNYDGPQLAYAVSELKANKKINLVTLSIGANDVLLMLKVCGTDPACIQSTLPGVLAQYGANLQQILTGLRKDAKYKDTLVLVKYYSPDPNLNSVTQALNDVMAQVGSAFDVRFADGFLAFQIVSAPFGGDPCKAGLLTQLAPGVCDVHPSAVGQKVLAGAVEAALR